MLAYTTCVPLLHPGSRQIKDALQLWVILGCTWVHVDTAPCGPSCGLRFDQSLLHKARHWIVQQSATVCDSRQFSQGSPVTRATWHIVLFKPNHICVLRMESDKRLLRICQLLVLLCFAARPVSAHLKGLQHVNGEDVVSQVYD